MKVIDSNATLWWGTKTLFNNSRCYVCKKLIYSQSTAYAISFYVRVSNGNQKRVRHTHLACFGKYEHHDRAFPDKETIKVKYTSLDKFL